jgi:hypothetical protein
MGLGHGLHYAHRKGSKALGFAIKPNAIPLDQSRNELYDVDAGRGAEKS